MKKNLMTATALTGLALVASSAMAQEVGRVISSTPVVQQVGVPRQVCSSQPTIVGEQKSGAGALMGALAGGGLGNAVGQGTGKALATMAGVMGGAILGNSIEGGAQQVQNVQTCSTQTIYENRNVGYNVVYEYGGKQYTVQMPNEPGPTIQLQVTPVGAANAAPQQGLQGDYTQGQVYQQQQQGTQGVIATQTYVQPQPIYAQPTYVAPPVYTAPYYASPYYAPYYAPIGLSLGFGFRGGYHGGHGRRH